MAVRAFVLITLEPTKSKNAIRLLQSARGVRHCATVTGRFDCIIEVEAKDNQELAEAVLSNIRTVEGVRRTESLIATD